VPDFDLVDERPGELELSERTLPSFERVAATVVSRGIKYGTAFEVALKIRELSGLVVEAYPPADPLHGPIAAVQPGWPAVVVAPDGPALQPIGEIVRPLQERRATIVAIANAQDILDAAEIRLPPAGGVSNGCRL
jgi:glucosamine--fructose-6-phosphate aminotransferase (isomerizing)